VRIFAVVLLASTIAVSAAAGEEPVQLKQAPGLDKVETNCGRCHSLDYVVMNSPFPTATLWDAEVAKMIKAFGAPIDATDAKIIADYLKKNYGSRCGCAPLRGRQHHIGNGANRPTAVSFTADFLLQEIAGTCRTTLAAHYPKMLCVP
jgi:hypothetical protein